MRYCIFAVAIGMFDLLSSSCPCPRAHKKVFTYKVSPQQLMYTNQGKFLCKLSLPER